MIANKLESVPSGGGKEVLNWTSIWECGVYSSMVEQGAFNSLVGSSNLPEPKQECAKGHVA